jgi:hypothetical protein
MQLQTLGTYGDFYQALLDGDEAKPIGRFGKRFAAWDASTTYVLALAIAKADSGETDRAEMFTMLGSYIIRRAICDLTNKNYNKVFLQVIKNLKGTMLTPATFRTALEGLRGDAARWPRDDEFRRCFMQGQMYPGALDTTKMRSVLVELGNELRTERTEEPVAAALANLDIDHMLPREWTPFWPLQDGSKATAEEVLAARFILPTDTQLTPKQSAIQAREAAIPTFGNLTLLHYGTNRAAKHHAFSKKRDLFLRHSNLHLNRDMLTATAWDEAAIQSRAESLYRAATRIWPAPLTSLAQKG